MCAQSSSVIRSFVVDGKMMSEIHIAPENVWKIDWLVEIVRRASDNYEKGVSIADIDMKSPWRKRKVSKDALVAASFLFILSSSGQRTKTDIRIGRGLPRRRRLSTTVYCFTVLSSASCVTKLAPGPCLRLLGIMAFGKSRLRFQSGAICVPDNGPCVVLD